MTTNPAITALALIELLHRHLAEPGDNDARTEELRALFRRPTAELARRRRQEDGIHLRM